MPNATVILVHGLWMTGLEMSLLQRRLAGQGFTVHRFRYPMMRQGLAANLDAFAEFVRGLSDQPVHVIGHSLGGVLTLHALQATPELPVDRVVCLGSPLVDSASARRLLNTGVGHRMVGETLRNGVLETPLQHWEGPQTVGVIAGSYGVGLGRLLGRLARPHDGMVTVAETCLPGISDHLVLPVSHTAMLISKNVAAQCGYFLRHGEFSREQR